MASVEDSLISADELRGVISIRIPRQKTKRVFRDEEDAKQERIRQQSRARAKKARELNLERSRATQALYRAKNREKIARLKEAWRKKNIAVIRKKNAKRMREWREKNRELSRAREKAWALANRDHINAKRRERYAKRKQLEATTNSRSDRSQAHYGGSEIKRRNLAQESRGAGPGRSLSSWPEIFPEYRGESVD